MSYASWPKHFTQVLNERIQLGVEESLAYYESADRTEPGAPLHERCTSRLTDYNFYSKRATGRFREYTFVDKVVVSQVQTAHVRPFQLAESLGWTCRRMRKPQCLCSLDSRITASRW